MIQSIMLYQLWILGSAYQIMDITKSVVLITHLEEVTPLDNA